jgi:hypothetical protein
MNQANSDASTARVVSWFLWVPLAAMLPYLRLFLFRKPTGPAPPWTLFTGVLYLTPIVLVVAIRWFVIPKLRNRLIVLLPFVFGLLSAFALTLFGLYVVGFCRFELFYYTNWVLFLVLLPVWKIAV